MYCSSVYKATDKCSCIHTDCSCASSCYSFAVRIANNKIYSSYIRILRYEKHSHTFSCFISRKRSVVNHELWVYTIHIYLWIEEKIIAKHHCNWYCIGSYCLYTKLFEYLLSRYILSMVDSFISIKRCRSKL